VKVSVVVVARNEEGSILACLRSLAALDYPVEDHEVLVVDNASTDRTADLVQEHARGHPNVRLVSNPVHGAASSRNVGLREARHPWVAFTDADCLAEAGWLRALTDAMREERAEDRATVAVGGPNVAPAEATRFREAVAVAVTTFWGSHGSVQGAKPGERIEVNHLPTLNVLYDRGRLLEQGGFDEGMGNIGEDVELSHRLRARNLRLVFEPGAVVAHRWCEDAWSWVRIMEVYGKGRGWFLKKHPDALRLEHAVPLGLLLGTALASLSMTVPLWLIPAAYLVITAAVSARACHRARRLDLLPRVFLVFILTHYPYGLGELHGLLSRPGSGVAPSETPPTTGFRSLPERARRRDRGGPGLREFLGPVILLVLVGLVIYANSFSVPFVFDGKRIIGQAWLEQLWPFELHWQARTRPLAFFTFALNRAVLGPHLWAYHLVNLVIHLSASIAVFAIVRRTLVRLETFGPGGQRSSTVGLCVALLWMAHPLQTGSVTYLVQRTEALMGLFFLLTLYCFIRGVDASRGAFWYVASTVCCALGMATKEVMVSAPLVVALYDWTFVTPSWRRLLRRRGGYYAALASTWMILAFLLVQNWVISVRLLGYHSFAEVSSVRYALMQPGVILHYLRLAVLPRGLTLDYLWQSPQGWDEVIVPLLVVLSLLAITAWNLLRRSAWGFVGAFFLLVLAPTSSVLPIRDPAFEHRMYLPLLAVVLVVVLGADWVWRRKIVPRLPTGRWWRGVERWAPTVVLCGAVVVLAGLTIARNHDYRSDLAIWRDTAAKRPGNPRAHNNLGAALQEAGDLDEAIEHYQRAIEILPVYAEAHLNLGEALQARGKVQSAIEHYQLGLDLKPENAEAHNNFASLLASQGRSGEAIVHLRRAVELAPETAVFHHNLGRVLVAEGRLKEATAHFERAVRLDPRSPEAHHSLGNALRAQGDRRSAIGHLDRAVELRPRDAGLRNSLGVALLEVGRVDDAIGQFLEGLEIQPDHLGLQRNLARARAMKRGRQGR